MAFGFGFYFGGLLATVICVVNAALLTKIEHKRIQALRFYVEVNDLEKIQSVLDQIDVVMNHDAFIETFPAKSGRVGSVGFEVTTAYKPNLVALMISSGVLLPLQIYVLDIRDVGI